MYYLVVVHKDPDSDYGVTVPDLPGCFSAGDSFEDALFNVKEAIECHIEGLLIDNEDIPKSQPIEMHQMNPDYGDAIWAVVKVISGKRKSLDKQLKDVRARAACIPATMPRAVSAHYSDTTKEITIKFSNATSFSFPAAYGQGLEGAPAEDLAQVEITPSGFGLHWESLDADLSIPELWSGIFGTQQWMANHFYGWLSVFDHEELHDFIQEVMEAYRLADCTKESPDTVSAIIHEWHESAIAIANPELAAAFSDDEESKGFQAYLASKKKHFEVYRRLAES